MMGNFKILAKALGQQLQVNSNDPPPLHHSFDSTTHLLIIYICSGSD